MKKPGAIFLFTTILFLCLSVSGHTEEGAANQYEQLLLEMINEARDNPLAMAESLGMDTDQILQDFPGLKDILQEGILPLQLHVNLSDAADNHTNDMLERGYYSHETLPENGSTEPPPGSPWNPEGDQEGYHERIIASGYEPAVTGESLGMLAFSNFIEPDDAVRLIFENMFMNELNPTKTEKRNILNPDFRDVGIGIGTGEFTMNGTIMNIYLATCDFAATDVHRAEMELITLINQARSDPLATAAALGIDPAQALANLPELHDILNEGIAPLRFNKGLYAATFPLVQQMRDTLQNGSEEPPPASPWQPEVVSPVDERATDNNYLPLLTGEIARILKHEGAIGPQEAAGMLFESIFRNELNPDIIEERMLLSPAFKDLGVKLDLVTIERGDDTPFSYWVMVGDFGVSIVEQQPTIVGVVYTDLNEDGIYSPGEGIKETAVSIEGTNDSCELLTGMAGQCVIRREQGSYKAVAYLPDEVREETIVLGEENQALWFRIQKK